VRSHVLLAFSIALNLSAFCDEGHHHTLTKEEIGAVHFQTSCSKKVEADFNGAVALLHSFQYEQTREAFEGVLAVEPGCAMADWGVAMSHFHGLWGNGDFKAGREALLKAKEVAVSNRDTTAREKAYIAALGAIYEDDSKDRLARTQEYERRMGEVQAAYPEDSEAAIFHALSLDVEAAVNPKTDRTFSLERKCGEILEPIFAKQPHHPGVAHYIIHCYDNPVLAEQGLTAARAYAKIAPASAHANHMPSHIFTRVGLWEESIASNISSAAIAAKAEETSKNGEARDQRLHAMDYLEYAYLQSGRVKQARTVVDEMTSLPPIRGLTLTGDYAIAAIPARYNIELGKWGDAAKLVSDAQGVPWAQAITWSAVGIGSARSGDLTRAQKAADTLEQLRDATAKQKNPYWADQIEVERREVAAWVAQESGKNEEALSSMRSAVELEDSMDKNAVTPGAVTPAREMLAQVLVLQNQPAKALLEYEAVLKTTPNRFNALYGAATAAESSGDADRAQKYFRKLTEVAVGDDRPEVETARKRVTLAMR